MDPVSAIAGGASAVIGTVMGVIGNLVSSGDRAKAMTLRQQAMNQFNIKLPDIDSIHASTVNGNAYDSIQEDPRLKDAQMSALDQLQQISGSGGLRAQDKAKLSAIESQSAQQERGQREALLQDANARGMGGSSSSLQAMLANQQGSATRASEQGMDVNAQAEQAALDALGQQAQLGTTIRSQDYNEAAQRAAAANQLGQFNATQDQSTSQFNTGLKEQNFQNATQLATAKAGAQNSMADAYNAQAQATQQAFSAGGQSASAGLGSVAQMAGYQNWQNQRKAAGG